MQARKWKWFSKSSVGNRSRELILAVQGWHNHLVQDKEATSGNNILSEQGHIGNTALHPSSQFKLLVKPRSHQHFSVSVLISLVWLGRVLKNAW